MPDPTPDPLAAYLDEVRQRAALTKAAAHGYTPRGEQLPGGPAGEWLIANLAAAADVPRLLAALDAVLELAGGWDAKAREIAVKITLNEVSDAGIAMRLLVHDDHQKHAKALREVISRELLGEGESR